MCNGAGRVMVGVDGIEKWGYFDGCPPEVGCICDGTDKPPAVKLAYEREWATMADAVVCICLQDRPARFAAACAELHRWGLCRLTRFYRPAAPSDASLAAARVPAAARGFYGCWESHRAVAIAAQREGTSLHVLILEDDFEILESQMSAARLHKLARCRRELPPDFELFLLGHIPMMGRPVWSLWPEVFRTRSGCTHAYVLSPSGQRHLAQSSYLTIRKQCGGRGRALDLWFAETFQQYAAFPQLVVQSCAATSDIAEHDGLIARLIRWGMTTYRHASLTIDIAVYFVVPVVLLVVTLLLVLFALKKLLLPVRAAAPAIPFTTIAAEHGQHPVVDRSTSVVGRGI